MKCSRCGSRYPNSCPVCREEEKPAPETPDHEEGHLLQEAMKPETARFCASFAFVAFTTTLVALFILDAPKPVPHIACAGLAVLSFFIGLREKA